MTTPLVLVHGGGFDSRCWDLLVPYLAVPVVAVDLPGRGRRPAPLESVTFADCAHAIVEDVDAAGFDEVVLVGHSLAGCSLPPAMAILGDRVRHAVFLAAMVPESGTSTMRELRPDVREHVEDSRAERRATMDPARAKRYFGNDLDDEQFTWCLERLVPEAEGLTIEPVDLSGLRSPAPRTWVRTTKDAILPPGAQVRFAARVGAGPTIDIDAGHMCMISQPAALAKIFHGIAEGGRAAGPEGAESGGLTHSGSSQFESRTLVDGTPLVEAESGKMFDNVNPATPERIRNPDMR